MDSSIITLCVGIGFLIIFIIWIKIYTDKKSKDGWRND